MEGQYKGDIDPAVAAFTMTNLSSESVTVQKTWNVFTDFENTVLSELLFITDFSWKAGFRID